MPASGSNGRSTAASRSDAASSTAPLAVTHDRCPTGERKKLSTPSDVCVSSSSVNHCCHVHPEVVEQVEALHLLRAHEHLYARRRIARRGSRAAPPAPRVGRTRRRSSGGTRSTDRGARARWPLRGRRGCWSPRSGGRTNPSVNSEEPLISKARSKPRTPRAWNIAVKAPSTITIHTPGQHEQTDGPVERHHRVAPVVAAGERGRCVLNTIRSPMNTPRVDERCGAPGQHEGAQRRVDHQEEETDPEREPQDHRRPRASACSFADGDRSATGHEPGCVGDTCLTRVRDATSEWVTQVSRRRRDAAGLACAGPGAAWRRGGPASPSGSASVARRGGSTCNASANRDRSRSSASSRLRACERESDAVARATGPRRSSSRARWRGPSDGEVATGKRTSTRVSDVLAC